MSDATTTAVTGLHHVTAIAGDAQENLEFYTGVLGMRLVKRSVNQDVTDTYHLFYADAEGTAGSDLTFFPWPAMGPGRRGIGLTNEVSLAVPDGALGWWAERLASANVRIGEPERRFGERVLPFVDPHGLAVTLTETSDARDFVPWHGSPVDAARQVRGLHAVRMAQRTLAPSVAFLEQGLGFAHVGEEGGWHRYAVGGATSGRMVDVQESAASRGAWGVGAVHHVAWRVPDDAAERLLQERVWRAGAHPTDVIDRFWFRSVYFKEPGGALFEIATDGPGFGIDEDMRTLGQQLILPPWLESQRAAIERSLPPLAVPAAV